jgi:hypothetical protein
MRGSFFYCGAVPPRWTAHKNPSKRQNDVGGILGYGNAAHQNIVFLFGGLAIFFLAESNKKFNLL